MKGRSMYYITTTLALCGALAGGLLILEKTKEQQNLLPEVYAEIRTSGSTTTTTQTQEQPTIATPQQTAENGYFLQLQEDTLYVYPKGQAAPIESYPVESAWLPEYDRILLQSGVYAKDLAALRQLLEDYTS